MPSQDRRAAARRKAWGRGPIILRFEPLEERQVLTSITGGASSIAPAIVGGTTAQAADPVVTAFDTLHNLDWGDSFRAVGTVQNQGGSATSSGFTIDVYASPTSGIGNGAVYVGTISIPAGLEAGQSYKFDQVMHAPPVPMSTLGAGSSYTFNLAVDPDHAVTANDGSSHIAPGLTPSLVTVTPHQQANLIGTGLTVSPSSPSWGATLTVNAQVTNNGQGNAPATRALVVLRDANGNEVGIGDLAVPELPAWQTAQVSGKVTLPSTPPTSLSASSPLTLAILTDADYATRPPLTFGASQGLGLDAVTLPIASTTTAPLPASQLSDLAVAKVQVPSTPLVWGQPFQVTTTVENDGKGDAGAFRARFLLVNSNRPNDLPLALADAQVPGLKAGYAQDVTQTIDLNGKLPAGISPDNVAGHVVVQLDPENRVDETNKGNDLLVSGPVSLKLLSRDGQSVTLPATTGSGTTTTAPTPSNSTGSTKTRSGSSSTPSTPAPATPKPTGRKVIVHAAHTKPAVHHLRVYKPATPRVVRHRQKP